MDYGELEKAIEGFKGGEKIIDADGNVYIVTADAERLHIDVSDGLCTRTGQVISLYRLKDPVVAEDNVTPFLSRREYK